MSKNSKPDPTLSRLAAGLPRHDVEKRGRTYMVVDRSGGDAIAKVRPIPNTDRFELFCWSAAKERWISFAPLGRMKLKIESVRDIVENDPTFKVSTRRPGILWQFLFGRLLRVRR